MKADYETCILAGGRSSRLKRDKSRLRLGPRTLLGHARAVARQLGRPVRVIRRDLVPRCGPLGGVYTALRTTRADAVLFLSCDMPFVSVGLLRQVVGRLRPRAAAAFVRHGGCAGFPFVLARTALPRVEGLLAAKELSLQDLAGALRAKAVRIARNRLHEISNVNTPADWARARETWRGSRVGCQPKATPVRC